METWVNSNILLGAALVVVFIVIGTGQMLVRAFRISEGQYTPHKKHTDPGVDGALLGASDGTTTSNWSYFFGSGSGCDSNGWSGGDWGGGDWGGGDCGGGDGGGGGE
jgi:hypothetical protein